MTRHSAAEQPRVFENAQAWYGRDVAAKTDWIYELSLEDVANLEQAVEQVDSQQFDLLNLKREDFPLGALGTHLRHVKNEVLHGKGFFLVRGVPVQRLTSKHAALAFMGLGLHFGDPVSQNGKGHILGHVKSLGMDFNDPETRGYQTSARLMYHSDYSDIVALLCLKTSKSGGASSLVSSTTLWNEMVKRRPDLAAALTEPFYYTRWGEIPEGKKRCSEVPPFTPWNNRVIAFMATRTTILKAQAFPEVPRLTQKQLEAMDMLEILENDPSIHLDMEFRPGDMQLVNNYAILHSRTQYEDWPEPEKRRHLLRLWLACDDGPELPPYMTNDFQGKTRGDRPNGIHVPGVPFKVPLDAE